MKKHIIILLLTVSFSTYSQENETLKITYRSITSEDQKYFEITNDSNLELYCNQFESKFGHQNKFKQDSLQESAKDVPTSNIALIQQLAQKAIQFNRYKTRYQIIRKDNHIEFIQKAGYDEIHIESQPKFNWEITNNHKEILGYQCQQATTTYKGRKYIAYFSPEIAISSGPYKFHGLPGLILEVSEINNNFSWQAQSIKKIKGIPFHYESKKNHTPISQEDYVKVTHNSLLSSADMIISDESRKQNRISQINNKFKTYISIEVAPNNEN